MKMWVSLGRLPYWAQLRDDLNVNQFGDTKKFPYTQILLLLYLSTLSKLILRFYEQYSILT